MGERLNGIQEVRGSIPLGSTSERNDVEIASGNRIQTGRHFAIVRVATISEVWRRLNTSSHGYHVPATKQNGIQTVSIDSLNSDSLVASGLNLSKSNDIRSNNNPKLFDGAIQASHQGFCRQNYSEITY